MARVSCIALGLHLIHSWACSLVAYVHVILKVGHGFCAEMVQWHRHVLLAALLRDVAPTRSRKWGETCAQLLWYRILRFADGHDRRVAPVR